MRIRSLPWSKGIPMGSSFGSECDIAVRLRVVQGASLQEVVGSVLICCTQEGQIRQRGHAGLAAARLAGSGSLLALLDHAGLPFEASGHRGQSWERRDGRSGRWRRQWARTQGCGVEARNTRSGRRNGCGRVQVRYERHVLFFRLVLLLFYTLRAVCGGCSGSGMLAILSRV